MFRGWMKWWIASLAGLLVVLAGCAGTSFSASCNNRTNSNTSRCDIEMTSLNGSWSRDVNLSYIASDGSLPMHLEVTVTSGTVQVSFPDVSGATVSEQATQAQPLVLETRTQVTNGQVTVTFESVNGAASGVGAVVEVGPAES